MFETILVPLDGSERAESALILAKDFAMRYEAKLILVRVIEHPYAEPYYLEDTYERTQKAERELVEAYLSHRVFMLVKEGIGAESLCLEGSVAENVLYAAVAHSATMIVMCRHGRGHTGTWPIGRNANRIVKAATCSVLLLSGNEPFPSIAHATSQMSLAS